MIPFRSEKVQWQVEPAEEEKSCFVVEERPDGVSLVANCAGEVIRAIALYVMVFDMVVEV